MDAALLKSIVELAAKDPAAGLLLMYGVYQIYVFTQRKRSGHNGTATQIGAIDHLTAEFKDFRGEAASRDATLLERQSEQHADLRVLKYQIRSFDERIRTIEQHIERCIGMRGINNG